METTLQCIGSSSIDALNASNRRRPIHCGCSNCGCGTIYCYQLSMDSFVAFVEHILKCNVKFLNNVPACPWWNARDD